MVDVIFRLPRFHLRAFIVCLALLGAPLAAAQTSGPPLGAPLVAFTPSQHDRIFIYDMNGAGRALTFGGFEHHIWGFSPDGCRILFTLAQPGRPPQMFTARLDGGDQRPLVQYGDLPAGQWGVWEPQWSPDGAYIAFTMIRFQPQPNGTILQTTHIAWIDAPAALVAPQVPAFYSVTGREFTPQWSPDGAWLAYVSYDERFPGADAFSTAVPTSEPLPGQAAPPPPPLLNEADLWVVSADGVTKYRLTTFTTGSARAPRWSPDGDLIGFIYAPSPNNDTFWMIGNAQGAIPTQLSFMWNLTLDHTWLPDSSAMLAAVRDFRGTSENRLWRIPLVGNADENAVLHGADEGRSHSDYPRFSADGRWLAFRSTYALAVFDSVTGQVVTLEPDYPGNTPPVWSPAAFAGEQACPD